jgi:hypothetical protein
MPKKIFTMLTKQDLSLNAYRTKRTGLTTRNATAERKVKIDLPVMECCNMVFFRTLSSTEEDPISLKSRRVVTNDMKQLSGGAKFE